jgi:hypothetical protein
MEYARSGRGARLSGPPLAPLLKGWRGMSLGFRWSVVLRTDSWRVDAFTPPVAPFARGERLERLLGSIHHSVHGAAGFDVTNRGLMLF